MDSILKECFRKRWRSEIVSKILRQRALWNSRKLRQKTIYRQVVIHSNSFSLQPFVKWWLLSFLCSIIWGEKCLIVLLMFVRLLTVAAKLCFHNVITMFTDINMSFSLIPKRFGLFWSHNRPLLHFNFVSLTVVNSDINLSVVFFRYSCLYNLTQYNWDIIENGV